MYLALIGKKKEGSSFKCMDKMLNGLKCVLLSIYFSFVLYFNTILKYA